MRALLVGVLAFAACASVAPDGGGLSDQERCARDGGRWRGDFCERGGGGGY
ncbi:MAG TPA: hypothetical protein VGL09_02080 [Methylomirabilota bacterium]